MENILLAEEDLPISISCVSDENYYCGLLVSLHSLCSNAAPGSRLKIHILDTGLKVASRIDLVKRLSGISDRSIDIQFHNYDATLFSSWPKWRGGYSAYARLVLQDILVDEEWTIYTDVAGFVTIRRIELPYCCHNLSQH